MSYSFYGGRRGASFVITGRFTSIAEMINSFSQGGSYTVINYDEYAIIDTVDKNDPDNGKVYKRGYNYSDPMGGAEYIGQIVGPHGPAPELAMDTVENIKNKAEQAGFEYLRAEGEYGVNTGSLVPGKDGDTYNDSISWASCSVRDANGVDTVAYIGFTFPYTVIDFVTNASSPYDADGNYVGETRADRIDDGSHPFYEKWSINIPHGIKGDSLQNLRMITAADGDGISAYPGQEEDRTDSRQILVYDYYNYDNKQEGEKTSVYLGDYNMISDVSINDNGTVTIDYTHQNNTVLANRLKWINSVTIAQDGTFTVNYNYGGDTTKYQTQLSWLNDAELREDGTLVFKYNNTIFDDISLDQKLKWIKSISVNTGDNEGEGNQKIHIVYNNNEETDIGAPLNYVMKTAINEVYHLLILYSDPAKRQELKEQGLTVIYDGRDDWYDVGVVRDKVDGILVGLNYEYAEIGASTIPDMVDRLNILHPSGLEGENLKGKIVSVGGEEDNKLLFAFDYSEPDAGTGFKGWYYLGMVNQQRAEKFRMCVVAGSNMSASTLERSLPMPAGTLWFCIENDDPSAPLPDYDFDEYIIPTAVYDALCVVAGGLGDAQAIALADDMIAGSIWFVTEGA